MLGLEVEKHTVTEMKALLYLVVLLAHLVATAFAIRGSFDRLATKHAGVPPNFEYERVMFVLARVLEWPVAYFANGMLWLPASDRLAAYVLNSALWAGVVVWIAGVIARRKKNA